MKLTRMHITLILGIITALWFGVLLLQGTEVKAEHLAPFGTVVSALVMLSILTEHWFWRIMWLNKAIFKTPDLRGTWHVEMKSEYVDPETGKQKDPIECYYCVTQSLSKLQMHLMTPESESWLIASSIDPSPKGLGFQISAVYTNRPGIHQRGKKSEIHYGAFIMETHGDSDTQPSRIIGEYWTDRITRGALEGSLLTRKRHTLYSNAQKELAAASIKKP
jgi:hypothetical protein